MIINEPLLQYTQSVHNHTDILESWNISQATKIIIICLSSCPLTFSIFLFFFSYWKAIINCQILWKTELMYVLLLCLRSYMSFFYKRIYVSKAIFKEISIDKLIFLQNRSAIYSKNSKRDVDIWPKKTSSMQKLIKEAIKMFFFQKACLRITNTYVSRYVLPITIKSNKKRKSYKCQNGQNGLCFCICLC